MEAIEFLSKNPNEWFETSELIKIENKVGQSAVLRKLQRIYNSKWRQMYNLERKMIKKKFGQTYLWKLSNNRKFYKLQNPK